jgi:phosphopantothenoylcysteine decarboxylase / phosphopantothenate---cysteine ligase
MWAHPQVQANVQRAGELGYQVLPPDDGLLAAGEGSGPGRMPEPETILTHIGRLLEGTTPLGGRHVVVTAGPTREPLDPVRYVSNRSSGRMGVEIAAAAWRRGARVTLVAGPLEVAVPAGVTVVPVERTAEMRDAVAHLLPDADALVMAAAPADYAPAAVATSKIKKGAGAALSLDMIATPDILASTIGARRAGAVVVGFALETDQLVAHASAKLKAKSLDLVVANDATEPGAGFGVPTNRVTLVARDGAVEELPLMPKHAVADAILDRVERLLSGR